MATKKPELKLPKKTKVKIPLVDANNTNYDIINIAKNNHQKIINLCRKKHDEKGLNFGTNEG